MASSLYQYQPSEGTILAEIYLPKKAKYQGILYEALTGGFDYGKVKKYIEDNLESIKELYYKISKFENEMLNWLDIYFTERPPLYNGYSMYEVDGVFRGEKGEIIEERTQVIRIIFRPNLEEIHKKFKLERDNEIKNQYRIRNYIKTFLRIPYHSVRFAMHHNMNTKEEYIEHFFKKFWPGDEGKEESLKLVEYISEWSESAALFLFGYIMHNICKEISKLRIKENEKGEEEIWVTSFWSHNVNRVILNEGEKKGR